MYPFELVSRRVAFLVTLVGVAMVCGCGAAGDEEFPTNPVVFEVYGQADSDTLELGVGSCNKNPRAEVNETGTSVRITVVVDAPATDRREDCRDSFHIQLHNVLGDRRVYDDVRETELEVLPPSRPVSREVRH